MPDGSENQNKLKSVPLVQVHSVLVKEVPDLNMVKAIVVTYGNGFIYKQLSKQHHDGYLELSVCSLKLIAFQSLC